MDAALLHQLVGVESALTATEALPLRPQRSVIKTYPAVPERERESFELASLNRPATQGADRPFETATPGHDGGPDALDLDLEGSRPSSPVPGVPDGVDALQSVWDPYMNRFRLLSACLMGLGNGMSDSAAGPIIPYMEKYYNIGYAVVSLLFVGQAIGFVLGAGLIDPIRARLGRGRALALAQLLMAGGYVIIALTAPFPAIIFAYFLVGLGMTINLALGNIFCGSLTSSTAALGMMHGSYGIGGISGPLVANAFVSELGLLWSRYYLLTLGMTIFNGVLALWAYWHFEKEDADSSSSSSSSSTSAAMITSTTHPETQQQPSALARLQTILSALTSRVVLLGALFIFAYQGAEVSISGWVISFLEDARGGDPARVGYVTSGFWAGITLGRFVLSAPAQRVGERLFVLCVVLGAAAFELLVWLVPSVVGGAVAVAVVGLLLGPVYPCSAAVFMRSMSRGEKLRGMGVISAFGASGGAVAPFTTGLLSQASGTFVLHPIAIGLFGAMLLCWYGLPDGRKRRD